VSFTWHGKLPFKFAIDAHCSPARLVSLAGRFQCTHACEIVFAKQKAIFRAPAALLGRAVFFCWDCRGKIFVAAAELVDRRFDRFASFGGLFS
jgi:hypothetical protein